MLTFAKGLQWVAANATLANVIGHCPDQTHQPRQRGRARRALFADLLGTPLESHSAA